MDLCPVGTRRRALALNTRLVQVSARQRLRTKGYHGGVLTHPLAGHEGLSVTPLHYKWYFTCPRYIAIPPPLVDGMIYALPKGSHHHHFKHSVDICPH